MGEVYKARDTRLARTVAIKVLLEHLSSNPQLRERFDRNWRADGKELYYVAADRKLMAVPVKTSPSFEAGAPVQLFETRVDTSFGIFFKLDYAVSGDGKRFLLATPIQATQLQPIRVVVNWTEALKR